MTSRWETSDTPRGVDYDERFARLARSGHDVHGEASFVMGYQPTTVLDAGCGTGRVAIELRHRGVEVVGVDLDRSMLETACEKEPEVEWYRADLSTLALLGESGDERAFDLVITAGNVMIFLEPATEAATVERLAAHVGPGGRLVSGFQLTADRYGVERYDRDCAAVGLELVERFSTWSRDPWTVDAGYAVSVHARVSPAPGVAQSLSPEEPSG